MSTEQKQGSAAAPGHQVTPQHENRIPRIESRGRSAVALAVTRIAVGFVFLWAFLDKTFGFGYATPSERAWINGGSPTEGFLSNLQAGPLRGMFQAWAGEPWADWLFMLGLAGIGIAVILGIGLRISAVAASLMMLMMWAAEWPLARFGYSGEPTMSTNPFMDYHLIYALVLIVCAAAYAGHTWGLGRFWEKTALVGRNRWLL
ncbi:MAG: DoxX family membrane protein [Streptosporangiales bacterium]|nr:DoxX family membrane protein [Streptosporangiales bacterium]